MTTDPIDDQPARWSPWRVASGLAILVVTVARGGGPTAVGILFGLVFVAMGAGRLYLSLRG